MKLTGPKIDELRLMMTTVLAVVEKKHNIKIEIGSIKYSNNWFECKVTGQVEGALTREQIDYDNNRIIQRLPKRGFKFYINNKEFELYGWKRRARKNKLVIINVNTKKRFITSVDIVKHELNEQSWSIE